MARRATRTAGRVTASVAAPMALSVSSGVRMVSLGVATLDLPFWPSEIEISGLAPTITETEVVGSQPTLYRGSEPRPQLRISFTLRGRTLAESATRWLGAVQAIAAAKPVVRLITGATDRGTWQVSEAGYTETDWTAAGEPAIAEVAMTMKWTTAEVPVGPIPKKKKKSKAKSGKKSSKAKKPKTKTPAKTKTKKDT